MQFGTCAERRLAGAESIAKAKERGIWNGDFEMPWDWRHKMRE